MVQEGFDFIKDAFINTNLFGADWIIPLATIFMTLLLITRDYENWKVLAFPVGTAYQIIGLHVGFIILAIAGTIFVISSGSVKVLGSIAQHRSISMPFIEKAIARREEAKHQKFLVRQQAYLGAKEESAGKISQIYTSQQEALMSKKAKQQAKVQKAMEKQMLQRQTMKEKEAKRFEQQQRQLKNIKKKEMARFKAEQVKMAMAKQAIYKKNLTKPNRS